MTKCVQKCFSQMKDHHSVLLFLLLCARPFIRISLEHLLHISCRVSIFLCLMFPWYYIFIKLMDRCNIWLLCFMYHWPFHFWVRHSDLLSRVVDAAISRWWILHRNGKQRTNNDIPQRKEKIIKISYHILFHGLYWYVIMFGCQNIIWIKSFIILVFSFLYTYIERLSSITRKMIQPIKIIKDISSTKILSLWINCKQTISLPN